jgi:membrane protease YdiL (CAAX protease family)
MVTEVSEVQATSGGSVRVRCWAESLLLGLGMPTAMWVAKKIISTSIPAVVNGSPAQRFLLRESSTMIVEWGFVVLLWIALRKRGSSFKEFGVWRVGTWAAWTVALLFAGLSIANNLRVLRFMHVPVSAAFFPSGFHLIAALLIGITAGFCEEVLFRAFLMTEFASAGYSKFAQVLIPGVAFGLLHAGFLSQGFVAWLGIVLPTSFLGMIWGVAYLLGRRSLVPSMVAHFLNDSTALPWILFYMTIAR